MSIIKDIKKYIIWPDENGLKEIEKKEFNEAVKYGIIEIIVGSILSGITAGISLGIIIFWIGIITTPIISNNSSFDNYVWNTLLTYTGMTIAYTILIEAISLLLSPIIFSLTTKIIKPEVGYKNMFKWHVYVVGTPYYYLSWIPVIGIIIGSILMLINGIRGLKAIAKHDSYVKSIGICIVAIVILIIIYYILSPITLSLNPKTWLIKSTLTQLSHAMMNMTHPTV